MRRLDWFGASAAVVAVVFSTASWIATYRPADPLWLLHPLLIATPILGVVPPCLLMLAVLVGVPRAVTRGAGMALLMWSIPSYLWLITNDEARWSRRGVAHWWITSRSLVFLAVGAAIGVAIVAVAHHRHGARPT